MRRPSPGATQVAIAAWIAAAAAAGPPGAVPARAAPVADSLAAAAPAAPAAPLDGRVIRTLQLERHSIFDPLPRHGRAFYAFADRMHVRTQPATVRAALVFREGGTWSDAAGQESARHLRALSFIIPDSIVALPAGADSVDVKVVTHDNWSTSPEFNIESGGGQRFTSFAFNERNFLGRGTSVVLGYREELVGVSRFARLDDGELFGSHWRGRAILGNGTAGNANTASLVLPFWADDSPTSMGIAWRRERIDNTLFSNRQEVATVGSHRQNVDLFWGVGQRAADGTIQRMMLTFESQDRALAPAVLVAGAPPGFAAPEDDLRIRRAGAELILTRPHWIVRRGVEQMDRTEDFDIGPALALKLGFSPHAFGGTHDEAFARARLHLGADAGPLGFGDVRTSVQARVREGLAERTADVTARWVKQPTPRLAAVGALWGSASRDVPADYQLTLGGVTGLRAFDVHEMTGTEAWRANAELRWVGVRDWLRLVSIGAAAFWDSGRTWGTGAVPEPWHQDAGFGLRLSLPHSSLDMIARFDVAWPLTPMADGRHGPVYSFGSGQAF